MREDIDSVEEMPLLLERFRRFVKLTTSPPKKKLTTSPPKKMDLKDNFESFESSKLKNEKEIQRLKEELLRLSTQVDDLNDEVIRSMVEEDKLKYELALSKRNEEGLKRELVEAKESLTRMTTSTKKLDNILGVGKSPCDKRGLGFKVSKDCSIPKKTVFV